VAIKNGQKTFNFGIKVPDAKAEEVETAIRDHAQWMRETHSLDESKIQLVHYYASKSPDFKNPMNPEEGTTGHVVFSINEVMSHRRGLESTWPPLKNGQDFQVFSACSQRMETSWY